jgi:hypothetical protein
LIDSTKNEIENQFTTIEEIPSNDRMINVPQGSIASDIQQVEDLSYTDKNSDIEQVDSQQPIINDINNLNLDTDEINFSANAYQQRFFDMFNRQYSN